MPLFACEDCDHAYSDKALACPGCGRLVRGRGWWAVTIGWGVIMSAVISLVLSVVVTIAVVVLLGGAAGVAAYLGSRDAPASRASAPPSR